MTVRTLPLFDGFIETPFERRFQALLRQASLQRSWHVMVAEPGSGKTMGIGDLRNEAARQAGMVGGRRYPILAVTAPKNDPREAALGNLLLGALGVGSRGRWSERKFLLYDLLGQYGVECLVVDDAHDLSMPHLLFLKEVTDHLFLAYPSHALGLCLVTAGRGASIPLKDVFDQPETMWMQFRRRLDCSQPYCRVVSHTEGEVRDILLALEQIYHPSFPAFDNGAEVVVCSTRGQCDLQTSQGCGGTPRSSSGHHPDHRRRKQPLQRKRTRETGVGRRTGAAEAKGQKSERAEKTALF